jgi:ketosteroid isomerase-like protein
MTTRPETEAENVVAEFLAAGNRSDVAAQLLLVTDDVRVEIAKPPIKLRLLDIPTSVTASCRRVRDR